MKLEVIIEVLLIELRYFPDSEASSTFWTQNLVFLFIYTCQLDN